MARERLALILDLETVAYSVSRDLQASLGQTEAFLDRLAESLGPSLKGEAARSFLLTRAAARQMELLICPLLHHFNLQRQTLEQRPLDLGRLVAEAVEACAGEHRDRKVSWSIDPLPVIQGDAGEIRTVFRNLLGNALKFTARRPQAIIQVGCAPCAGSEVVIFVRDNGAGFDPALAPRLFKVFQRLHRQEDYPGAGIGLAQVARIVQRHGGRVWAEGRPDLGATFYVAFPGLPGPGWTLSN